MPNGKTPRCKIHIVVRCGSSGLLIQAGINEREFRIVHSYCSRERTPRFNVAFLRFEGVVDIRAAPFARVPR